MLQLYDNIYDSVVHGVNDHGMAESLTMKDLASKAGVPFQTHHDVHAIRLSFDFLGVPTGLVGRITTIHDAGMSDQAIAEQLIARQKGVPAVYDGDDIAAIRAWMKAMDM